MGCGANKYASQVSDEVLTPEDEVPVSNETVSYLSTFIEDYNNQGWIGEYYVFDNSVLTRDSFTSVRRVTNKKTKDVRAVKSVDLKKAQGGPDAIMEMVGITALVQHPSIIKLHETFRDNLYYYCVLDFYLGGTLYDRLAEEDRHTEREAANVLQQVLKGVAYMHDKMVCHRDLKAEHVMLKTRGSLEEIVVKIIDFKAACMVKEPDEVMQEKAGTPYYSAPQMSLGGYTLLCDVWSCGVIMYLLVLGFPRKGSKNRKRYSKKAEVISFSANRHDFTPTDWSHCSDLAGSQLGQMLAYDERERVSAQLAVKHEWIVRQAPQIHAGAEEMRVDDEPGSPTLFRSTRSNPEIDSRSRGHSDLIKVFNRRSSHCGSFES